jgi:hypothetical protein
MKKVTHFAQDFLLRLTVSPAGSISTASLSNRDNLSSFAPDKPVLEQQSSTIQLLSPLKNSSHPTAHLLHRLLRTGAIVLSWFLFCILMLGVSITSRSYVISNVNVMCFVLCTVFIVWYGFFVSYPRIATPVTRLERLLFIAPYCSTIIMSCSLIVLRPYAYRWTYLKELNVAGSFVYIFMMGAWFPLLFRRRITDLIRMDNTGKFLQDNADKLLTATGFFILFTMPTLELLNIYFPVGASFYIFALAFGILVVLFITWKIQVQYLEGCFGIIFTYSYAQFGVYMLGFALINTLSGASEFEQLFYGIVFELFSSMLITGLEELINMGLRKFTMAENLYHVLSVHMVLSKVK